MAITETIIEFATHFIDAAGYPGILLLMILESMIAPIPSEAVMPFAGFLIHQGTMTWLWVVFASTLGSIIGSLISYWIGAYGGRPLVLKFGKYLLLNEHHLEASEKFFQRRGSVAIFVSRFIPVVRHFISIPAGISRMPLGRFVLFTTIGAGLWNSFLAWVGVKLGENWERIHVYGSKIDIVVVAIILGVIIYYGRELWRQRRIAPPTP
ncbi:MAG: DedA family protein [Candidatus Kerfeldbacteria bacterium]|nr:DedA family protein [Candidatus Kerfeldbacteria bacterium]